MAAKSIEFSSDARGRMLHGIEVLADVVRVTLGPKAAAWCSTIVRHAASHQGRRSSVSAAWAATPALRVCARFKDRR
jgi:hypothetical protein